ncbi:hypothetical protein O181_014627 [Austropuccinia psidii MF-1]|uniref:beta-galactosidase n=1 Tax=Austropuccinia psidii MF-1 TaxID=1389203 RepID=A0A9Q3GQ06_9BASI|nr:hypothetical protein [Austropuccinia psidii MF-1]
MKFINLATIHLLKLLLLFVNQSFGQSIITWDRHSVLIDGKRTFIQSGEFHPWRLPVVSLWKDVIQKFAAAGLNTVSIYVHWGLVNPVRGQTDWQGFRSLQPLFDAARDAGLYVLVRPGPYIQAETTAGGIPGWVTTLACPLRTNATDFAQSWRQYWTELSALIKPNQVGLPNGTVIAVQVENEYLTDSHSWQGQPSGKDGYMRDLIQALKKNGISVPLIINDAGMDKNYASGMGSADIYGFDAYPQSFDCSKPFDWKPVVETYHSYQDSLRLNSPLSIPEFQGGSYDPWGSVGYENCRKLTGPGFESVFYLNNLAANAKFINYYMVYGGTSWGQLPFPGTYTSYDYGAAISEDRSLNEKYIELKRQSLFLKSSGQFYQTDVIGDSAKDSKYFLDDESARNAYVTELKNPVSETGFYITRARDSTSRESTKFKLKVETSAGQKLLPSITLPPRRSKVLVTDYHTPAQTIKLLYTTSHTLLSANVGGREVLYMFSDKFTQHPPLNEMNEVSVLNILDFAGGHLVSHIGQPASGSNLRLESQFYSDGYREIKWQVRDDSAILALSTQGSVIIMTSEEMAGKVWNPKLLDENSEGSGSILIWGPWLVRKVCLINQSVEKGSVLKIWGDLEEGLATNVILYVGGLDIRTIEWNGNIQNIIAWPHSDFLSFSCNSTLFREIMAKKGPNSLIGVGTKIDLARLPWNYRDSLPEIMFGFNDDQWTDAALTNVPTPYKNLYGKYYLYACNYGFCNGATVWRGRFQHNCNASLTSQLRFGPEFDDYGSINLTIAGGESFAASAWLNDVFLGSVPSERSKSQPKPTSVEKIFYFPSGSLIQCGTNVITVVQDSMGMDLTEDGFADTIKHPRGILGYKLEVPKSQGSSEPLMWKVQGHLGGFYWLPDPVRGIYNENGFHAIRSGWHLPSFSLYDGSGWSNSSPFQNGLERPGIGFYRTSFELDFPPGFDVLVSFQFRRAETRSGRYRVEFWVNGWHMGKMISYLGPQTRFPVHEGILNYQGPNAFAMTLWALDEQGAALSGLELVVDKVLEGGIGNIEKHNPEYHASRRF